MEFEDLGARCSLPSCRLQDYLPYKCPHCHQNFCHAHRNASSHNCISNTKTAKKAVVECHDCGQVLGTSLSDTESARLLTSHYRKGCSKAKTKGGIHGGCKGCRKKVGFGGGMRCQYCRENFCVDCRLPQDHGCAQYEKHMSKIGSNSSTSTSTSGRGTSRIKRRSSLGIWERAKKALSSGKKRSPKAVETRPNKRVDGKIGNEWGVWVIAEERSGRQWVALEPNWSVGKAIDVIGEKFKLSARDSNGKRLDLVVNGKVQDRLNKLNASIRKGQYVSMRRALSLRKSPSPPPSPSCRVEAKGEKRDGVTGSIRNMSC